MRYFLMAILSLGVVLNSPYLIWAHPPESVELQYDKDQGILHVKIQHVVRSNSNRHYIKKLEIYKNQEPPTEQFNHSQKSPSEDQIDVPIKLQGGDTVRVIAFCVKGGTKEATLAIPAEDTDEKKK